MFSMSQYISSVKKKKNKQQNTHTLKRVFLEDAYFICMKLLDIAFHSEVKLVL